MNKLVSKKWAVMLLTVPLSVLMLTLSPSLAAHENEWYFELSLGQSKGTGEIRLEGPSAEGAPDFGLDSSLVRGVTVGYQMIKGLSLELELRDRELDLGGSISQPAEQFNYDGVLDVQTLMLSVAYRGVLISPDWYAHLEFGLGQANNKLSQVLDISPSYEQQGLETPVVFAGSRKKEIAFSLGAGVRYMINEELALGVDYQYTNIGEAETQLGESGDRFASKRLAVHEVSLGIRFYF